MNLVKQKLLEAGNNPERVQKILKDFAILEMDLEKPIIVYQARQLSNIMRDVRDKKISYKDAMKMLKEGAQALSDKRLAGNLKGAELLYLNVIRQGFNDGVFILEQLNTYPSKKLDDIAFEGITNVKSDNPPSWANFLKKQRESVREAIGLEKTNHDYGVLPSLEEGSANKLAQTSSQDATDPSAVPWVTGAEQYRDRLYGPQVELLSATQQTNSRYQLAVAARKKEMTRSNPNPVGHYQDYSHLIADKTTNDNERDQGTAQSPLSLPSTQVSLVAQATGADKAVSPGILRRRELMGELYGNENSQTASRSQPTVNPVQQPVQETLEQELHELEQHADTIYKPSQLPGLQQRNPEMARKFEIQLSTLEFDVKRTFFDLFAAVRKDVLKSKNVEPQKIIGALIVSIGAKIGEYAVKQSESVPNDLYNTYAAAIKQLQTASEKLQDALENGMPLQQLKTLLNSEIPKIMIDERAARRPTVSNSVAVAGASVTPGYSSPLPVTPTSAPSPPLPSLPAIPNTEFVRAIQTATTSAQPKRLPATPTLAVASSSTAMPSSPQLDNFGRKPPKKLPPTPTAQRLARPDAGAAVSRLPVDISSNTGNHSGLQEGGVNEVEDVKIPRKK